MWLLFSFMANIGIMWLERTYRTMTDVGFTFEVFLLIVISITVTQFSLFKLFNTAPSLLLAGAVFSVANGVLRIVNSHIIGEPVSWQVYIFVVVMMLCAVGISYYK